MLVDKKNNLKQDIAILLVDDQPQNLLVLEAVLSNLDAKLVMAESGTAALNHLLDQDFAVVLMDVYMQETSGYEVAAIMKQRERSQHTPIIFLTAADVDRSQMIQGYAVGAVDFLLKPIVPEILQAKVSIFIDMFKKTQQIQEQARALSLVNATLKEQLQANARLTSEISIQKDEVEHISFLAKASAILNESRDYAQTLAKVARLLVPRLADWCSIYIVQEDGEVKQLAVEHVDPAKIAWAYELQARYPTNPDAPSGLYHVLRTGQPEVVSDITDDMLVASAQDAEHLRIIREIGFTSAITLPLIAREQVIGVISLVAAESGHHYSEHDVQFAQELAHHCALAVDNARLYRQAQQQREYLQVTLNSIGDGLITTDEKGYVTLLNPIASALTGWTQQDAIGKEITTIFNIVNETTRHLVDNPIHKVIREGAIVGLANHTLLIAKDGREFPIDDSGAPIYDEEGKLRGIVLVFRDITERKHAENVLVESEERFRKMADTAPVLIWMSGTDTLCNYFNQSWLNFTGRTLEQEFGNGWAEGVHSEDFQRCLDIYLASFHAHEPFSMEYRLRHHSGQYVWVLDKGVPRFAPNGQFEGFIGSVIDIDVIKKAEAELQNAVAFHRQLEEQLTSLVETSNQLLSSLDLKAVLQSVLAFSNQLVIADAYAVWRFTSAEERWQIIHSTGLSMDYQVETLNNPSASVPFEKPLIINDIEQNDTLAIRQASYLKEGIRAVLIVPLRIYGQISGSLAFYHRHPHAYTEIEIRMAMAYANIVAAAIGSAERYEEAQKAIAFRDEFLSIAAHELKTPLTSLRGFAQLFARQISKTGSIDLAKIQQGMKSIDEQSAKLTRLVSQLLDISRLQSGKLILEYQSTDVVELLQGIAASFQATTDKHLLTIQGPSSAMIIADPLRVEQVFVNLIGNAVKYSPAGGPVTVTISQPSDLLLVVSIQDAGIGIVPENRPFIFNRFYQAHSDQHLGGLGLGLFISKQIIELHGGHIDLEFPSEGGTCAVVQLPVVAPA